ncbi:MAG: cytochrome c biogenesis protein ResB [Lentimicrobiaceae bacterium]|nr:cytochrome c biogenesis protein ResB [Lentimicrobiaceae bacterium]
MKSLIKYLRIILPHLGILLIILAMILGHFYNWRGKAVLLTTDKTNVFITQTNELKIVPYALTLNQFIVKYYDTGKPKSFEAVIDVNENNETKTISISVNHPYKMGFGQDLYLISYDDKNSENPEYCVVELVYDPFQCLFLAGIILVMVGMVMFYFIMSSLSYQTYTYSL